MEKYKYCNIGRAHELSTGGREGGREAGRQDGGLDCTGGRGNARKRGCFFFSSFRGVTGNAAFG